MDKQWQILTGDCIQRMRELPDKSVQCVVTSPPYLGLRSYFPNGVKLKKDAPRWVLEELKKIGVTPIVTSKES